MQRKQIQEAISGLAAPFRDLQRPPKMTELLESSTKLLESILPDEIEVLSELCRRIDEEENASLAWKMVSNVELTGIFTQPKDHKKAQEAIAFNILSKTVAYIDVKTDEKKIASGVFVEVGPATLLCTTAHSINGNPNGKLSFVGGDSTRLSENIAKIADFAIEDADERDVAYVEVDPDFVLQLKKESIPLARVFPRGTGQKNAPTFVGGYPSEEVRDWTPSGDILTKLFTLECWGSKVLPQEKWTAIEPRHRQASKDWDVFIPRSVTDEFESFGPLGYLKPTTLPEPFGMSGGGYWQKKTATGSGIWLPENYGLIAVQSRWWGLGRYIQGTQIIHWLRLIWKHRPDLRDALLAEFDESDLT